MTKKQTECWIDNTNKFMQEYINKRLYIEGSKECYMIAYKYPKSGAIHTFTSVLNHRGIDAVLHTIHKYGLKEFKREIRRINKLNE